MAMLLMTLGAWIVAFVVVLALLTLLGDQLKSLPLALRALLISGVLVSLMANLVMPVLSAAIARWLTVSPMSRMSRERRARVGARTKGDREFLDDAGSGQPGHREPKIRAH
jgi:antibiotic biosynthesis monooxygenase (ABM) superfamily enzyme